MQCKLSSILQRLHFKGSITKNVDGCNCVGGGENTSLLVCGLATLCDGFTVITALSHYSKTWETKHLAEWPYHLDRLLVEYSCKVRPCPVWTASDGSPLPELPQHGSLHWHRPGTLASCDRPSCFQYTQSTVEKTTGMTRKQRLQAHSTCGPSFLSTTTG